jgi:hypothetical protein
MADRILRTQNGSPIRRSSLGVGKLIGGETYLHRQYEDHVPNQNALTNAKNVLAKNHPGFDYNCLKFDRHGKFTFFNSPDFDTAHEPVAGKYVTVLDNNSKAGETKAIWHHKWMWVKDDYKGFDVDKSFERSKKWLALPNIDFRRIGNKELWEKEYVPKIK